ncbi:GumC family protein [Phenylobacterium sp. VNQ135]|uniref:GumC family protein n=1 Tax=Phenylobacterium sp. VNQ135 TaxID=3400922 RepID=UPI003BFF73AE
MIAVRRHGAEAVLMVTASPETLTENLLGSAGLTPALQRTVRSDVEILRSEPVLQAAALKLDPDLAQARESKRVRAAADLRARLGVETQPDSNLIRVKLADESDAMAVRGLSAVLDAYMEQRRRIYANAAAELQEKEVRRYQRLLSETETRIKAAEARFDVIDIDQDVALLTTRADALSQRLDQARERARAVDGELATTRARLNRAPGQVFESRESSNARPNDEARNTLLKLKQERAHLAAQYQPTWPAIRELDAKIAVVEQQIRNNARTDTLTQKQVRNPDLDQLNSRVSALSIERAGLSQQIADLSDQTHRLRARTQTIRQAQDTLRGLLRQRDVLEGVYKQLSLEQASAKLQNDAVATRQATLRMVQPPTTVRRRPSSALVLALGGFVVGLLAAGVATLVATVMRQEFIDPVEAERALGLPVIADAPRAALEPPFDPPDLRDLGAALADGRRDLQVLQISSPADPPAATAAAIGLVRQFADGWGRRTLLIDLEGGAFAASVNDAEASAEIVLAGAVWQVLKLRGRPLWMLAQDNNSPAAALIDPIRPTENVQEMLTRLKEHFETLVVVSPAAFGDYGARRFYPLADAHLLVLRAESTRVLSARRLKEIVEGAGGVFLGLVFLDRRFHIPSWLYRWI